ncbi:Abi family protein [Staphylococcus xylosus]|uniref:Abi family protein n=1 Tax=Staphylococcus xylosus TaxID=1288 RepID=UPI003F563199
MVNKKPKSTDGLMRHIRDNKGMNIQGTKQKRELRNIGYFHGYKGYTFFKSKDISLDFKNFGEISALYEFDSNIKTLFYKHVMFAETAIKNRILEIIHKESSVELERVFDDILIDYKKYEPGTKKYSDKFENTTRLRSDIYDMIHSNFKKKSFINHFVYNDRPVPLYAVFELFTLGSLVFFISCMKASIKIKLAKDLNLYLNSFKKKENIVANLVDCLKGLRNAIAHNGVLYDCRFKDSNVGGQLTEYLM